jgi:hypothetical protein
LRVLFSENRFPLFGIPRQRRIGDGNGERRPQALAQRDRQREAGKAGAADEHVDRLWLPRRSTHEHLLPSL